MTRIRILFALASAVVLLAPATLSSQEPERRIEFGAALGYLFEGEAYLAEIDRDVAVGATPLLHLNAGVPVRENVVAGGYANLAVPEIGPWTDGGTLLEIGVEVTPSFEAGASGASIAVPLNLGFRNYSTSDEFVFRGVTGDWTGLGTNAAVEYRLPRETYVLRGQLGFLAQPLGGNDESDVTFAPIYYLAVGIGY